MATDSNAEQTGADVPSTEDGSRAESAMPRRPSFLDRLQGWDVYTVLLGVALIAMLIACLVMYFQLARYGSFPQWRTT